ncbi:potassium-transporting ATPase subunit KdpA [Mycobacterium syngnathidarum]
MRNRRRVPARAISVRYWCFRLSTSCCCTCSCLYRCLREPWGHRGLTPTLAFNTAISFTPNTSWRHHPGEMTLGHVGPVAGLDVRARTVSEPVRSSELVIEGPSRLDSKVSRDR